MLLTFLLAAALWNCNCWWNAANIYTFAVQPGYLDFDNLPDTNFSCDGKVIGGYYADVETGCQMFHVCTIGQKAEITDIKFLCLNGTVFDQETRVCERLDEVDCSKSESFFDLNLELYGNNGAGYGIQPEEPPEQQPAPCNAADEEDCSGTSDYIDEEVTTVALPPPPPPPTASTTTTTTTTTTTRTTTATAIRTTSGATRTSTGPIGTTAKPHQQPAVSYPTNSPETIAALIALHNAFQESLKEREHGPGPKGQQSHRYRPSQQQPSPRPFTVTNLEPPRRFPSKAPPPYRHPEPVLLSSERFGNQNFRHGFRLENGPPPPPPPPPSSSSYQQQRYNGDDGPQYDGAIYDEGDGDGGDDDDDGTGRREADEDESRRNFAREAPEASVSVSVRVSSSSSSKDSAIDRQQQQQRRPAVTPAAATTTTTTTTTTNTPPSPAPADDADDLYEDEYEDDRPDGDEDEFFRDVPKLQGRNRRRRRHVVGGRRRRRGP